MIAPAELVHPIQKRPTIYTSEFDEAYGSFKQGKPDGILKIIGDGSFESDCFSGSQLQLRYQRDRIETVKLLPQISSDQALPVIRSILEHGIRGNTLQEIVIAAATSLSQINDPKAAELIPLVRQNLIRVQGMDGEYIDEGGISEFGMRREYAVQELGEAHTAALWQTAGRLKDSLPRILPLTRRGESFFVFKADPERRQIACWDLEGPLSGLDCAFDSFSLVPDGKQMYQAISYYDDIVSGLVPGKREWRREKYEAGDTLKLIVPHLIYHGVSEDDIRAVSSKATLVPGVKELFNQLRDEEWTLRIVSTSYSQHAYNIGAQLGLTPEEIACTILPLDVMQQAYSSEGAALVQELERKLKGFSPDDFGTEKDVELKAMLDRFYWQDLPATRMGHAMESVVVMGGARKAWAVERIARQLDAFFEELAFTGDSITDSQAAKVVEASRGLMTAFNGNEYVIPFATVGLGTTDMRNIKPILDVWQGNGREGLREWLENPQTPQDEFGPHYNWLAGADEQTLQNVISTHKIVRRKMREDAAALG